MTDAEFRQVLVDTANRVNRPDLAREALTTCDLSTVSNAIRTECVAYSLKLARRSVATRVICPHCGALEKEN